MRRDERGREPRQWRVGCGVEPGPQLAVRTQRV